MAWMSTIRRRALWIVVGVAATALGVISMTALPAWPVVGVAVATVAIVLNSLTRSLSISTCLNCGGDLASTPSSEHGRICPSCGALNQRLVGDYPHDESGPRDGAGPELKA